MGTAAEYRAARLEAVLADRSGRGRLFVTGKDALDLLHRLTTNDIRSLVPGQGTAAAVVTAKGRLIDLVVIHRLDDRILCETGEGRSAAVAEYIERYTFREEVRVQEASDSHGALGIFGARAGHQVEALLGREAAGLALHHTRPFDLAGIRGLLTRAYPLGGDGYHLIVEVPRLPALRSAILERSGSLVEAGPICLEVLRIEAGLPAAGKELTEEYNPWEARLQDAISLNKGCYVGQEVIARLNTYNKVSKCLVRLRLEGDPPAAGARLELGSGEPIGTLTSVSTVPGEDRVVALGYVRDEDASEGKVIAVVDGGRRLLARVLGPAR
jgi:tRNA-modifying protein YgfZ